MDTSAGEDGRGDDSSDSETQQRRAEQDTVYVCVAAGIPDRDTVVAGLEGIGATIVGPRLRRDTAFLVTTQSELDAGRRRVQNAQRYNTHVVSAAWATACIDASSFVPPDGYEYVIDPSMAERRPRRKLVPDAWLGASTADTEEDEVVLSAQVAVDETLSSKRARTAAAVAAEALLACPLVEVPPLDLFPEEDPVLKCKIGPATGQGIADASAAIRIRPDLTHARLPDALLKVWRLQNGGYVNPKYHTFPLEPSYVTFDCVPWVDEGGGGGSFGFVGLQDLREEWDMPPGLVLLCGDGHSWVALDYRGLAPDDEPPVVYCMQDVPWRITHLTATFSDFLRGLGPGPDAA